MSLRRLAPLLLWASLLALCALQIARTHFIADMSAFLPQHPDNRQQLLIDQLKHGVVSRTFLIALTGSTPEQRAQLSHDIAATLRHNNHFTQVRNGETRSDEADFQTLFQQRYLLSPQVTTNRFSVIGLHQAIGNSIDTLLNSPLSAAFAPLFAQDPTGELFAILNQIDTTRQHLHRLNDAWISTDGNRTPLIAQSVAQGEDTDAQQTNYALITRAFHDACQTEHIANAQLLVSGAPVFSIQSRATIEHEVKRLSLFSTLAVTGLLLFIYRSPLTLLLGLLPVISGVVVGIAAVSAGFGNVHGITVGFGTTLIGEAVDYTIYYFLQSGQTTERSWHTRFWPTIRLGMLTSVCGFASLLWSDFPGLEQIGLFSVTGLIAAAVTTRYVLPVLPNRIQLIDLRPIGTHLANIVSNLPRLRPFVGFILLCATAIIVLHRQPIWQHSLSGIAMISTQAEQQDALLRADLGTPDMRYLVVVQHPEQEQVLADTEQATRILRAWTAAGLIGGFSTPTDFLPAQATQRARRDSLPDADTLRQRLRQALQGLPIQANRLAPFVAAVQQARQAPLLNEQRLRRNATGLAVDAMLTHGQHDWIAMLPIQTATEHPFTPANLQTALQQAGISGVTVLDTLQQSNRIYANYLHQVVNASLLGLLAICAMLLLVLRSLTRLTRVMLPLAAALLLIMAGYVLAGASLSLFHLIGLLLIVAIGSNYALFFDRGQQHDMEASTLASLLFANLTTVTAFGILSLSHVVVLHDIASVVAPGAWLTLLLAGVFSSPHLINEPRPAAHAA